MTKNNSILVWVIMVGILLRIMAMAFFVHPDLKSQYFHGQFLSKGVVIKSIDANSTAFESGLRQGDIIVSINTNPTLMPALVKCKAIITDEGGLSCHASIISRELKKPCIVGTKIATKVLKDGDFVEVNADSGIVKIIK